MEHLSEPFFTDEIKKLTKGAEKLVTNCATVRPNEKVLVITDLGIKLSISYSIMNAALSVGAEATIIIMSVRSTPGEEPPIQVAKAMLASDVIIQSTSTIMNYTEAKVDACEKGARFLAMTGVTPEVLTSPALTDLDFRKHAPICERLTERLSKAERASVTTPAGTKLEFSLKEREAVSNPGFVIAPGEFSGTPNIEAYIAPIEDSINGIAVIDGTISVSGLVESPVTIEIKNGIAVKIKGQRDAENLESRLLDENTPSVYQVAELGIGLNPKAQIRGSIIEDEGVLGTIHIAIGDNTKFGGVNKAPSHIDLVQKDATLELDGEIVLKGREIYF